MKIQPTITPRAARSAPSSQSRQPLDSYQGTREESHWSRIGRFMQSLQAQRKPKVEQKRALPRLPAEYRHKNYSIRYGKNGRVRSVKLAGGEKREFGYDHRGELREFTLKGKKWIRGRGNTWRTQDGQARELGQVKVDDQGDLWFTDLEKKRHYRFGADGQDRQTRDSILGRLSLSIGEIAGRQNPPVSRQGESVVFFDKNGPLGVRLASGEERHFSYDDQHQLKQFTLGGKTFVRQGGRWVDSEGRPRDFRQVFVDGLGNLSYQQRDGSGSITGTRTTHYADGRVAKVAVGHLPTIRPFQGTVADTWANGVPIYPKDGFAVSRNWQKTALSGAITGGRLRLERLTPEMLKSLSRDQIRLLSMELNVPLMGKVDSRSLIAKSLVGKGYDAVAKAMFSGFMGGHEVLLRHAWGSGDSEAFARVWSCFPGQIPDSSQADVLFKGQLETVLNGLKQDGFNRGEALKDLRRAAGSYIAMNGGRSPQKTVAAAASLLKGLKTQGIRTPEQLGISVGTIVAALRTRLDEMKLGEQQKAQALGTFANLAKEGVGVAGALTGPAGGISAAVVSLVIQSLSEAAGAQWGKAKDLRGMGYEMLGKLEFKLKTSPPPGWGDRESRSFQDWVRIAMHLNRLPD